MKPSNLARQHGRKPLAEQPGFKRLTPDNDAEIIMASRAAQDLGSMHNRIMTLVAEVQQRLTTLQERGVKAEQLDHCVTRTAEIHTMLNQIELGSFFGITVKNTCTELWQARP